MSTWSATAKDAADSALPKIKCAKLMADLKLAGCQLYADGQQLKVKGAIPQNLRPKIMELKSYLLAQLGVKIPDSNAWSVKEADALIASIWQEDFSAGWPENDPDMKWKRAKAADKIDEHYLAKDMPGMKEAIQELRELLHD